MSDVRIPLSGGVKKDANKDSRTVLDDILSFGPDSKPQSSDLSNRINDLVKKLKEINRRIDRLSSLL